MSRLVWLACFAVLIALADAAPPARKTLVEIAEDLRSRCKSYCQAYGQAETPGGCAKLCSFIEHMITDHGSDLLKLYAEDEKLTNQAISIALSETIQFKAKNLSQDDHALDEKFFTRVAGWKKDIATQLKRQAKEEL